MSEKASTLKKQKPALSWWQIFNMSFGFFGIQMGFALQLANTSRIFQTLSAAVSDLPIYWLAGPVTGLIIQPIIGYMSDRTWHSTFGRRRPYFFVGALLATLCLFIMPNSSSLWIAIGMLWIMDSSFNVAMEPFRAYVGDRLPNKQLTTGFAMQSFLIGVGAVLASFLPYILTNYFGVANTAPEGVIPPSVKWAFYIGGVGFLIAVLYTVFTSKEYSPEEMASFADNSEKEAIEDPLISDQDYISNGTKHKTVGAILLLLGAVFAFVINSMELQRDLYVLGGIFIFVGLLLLISGFIQGNGKSDSVLVTITNDLQFMPATMKQLSAVQFFSWFGLFAMWIYSTPAVTEYIFGSTDPQSALYNEGADWVGVCFGVYNAVPIFIAFLLPVIAQKISRKKTHMLALFAGGLGLISISLISSPKMMLLSMIGVGIAWTSILSMPYAMLTNSLKPSKMGYYMGVFNFFIVLPQIVAASILAFMLDKIFGGASIYALVIGGASMIFAGILCLFVEDKEEYLEGE